MTNGEVFAWGVTISTIVGAIGAQIVNVVKEWRRVDRVGDKLDRATEKLDTNTALTKETADRVIDVSQKAAVIEGHVNSRSEKQEAKIDALQKQVDLMHSLLSDATSTKKKE